MLQIASTARLIPPSTLTGSSWLAEDAVAPRRFKIQLPAVVALLATTSPSSRAAVVAEIVDRANLSPIDAGGLVDQLLATRLMVDTESEADPEQIRFEQVSAAWSEYGWVEAAEYHLTTFDYPFIDYALAGRMLDSGRMHSYAEREPDTDRYKTYPGATAIPLPAPGCELVGESLARVLDAMPSRPVTRETLFAVLSLTFGEIGQITHGRWPRSPMMRRTSPSGGARHPIEGYVIVLDVPDVPPGTYHVACSPPRLEMISEGRLDEEDLGRMFPAERYREKVVNAIVVMTCVFARNMYRYREPRTFRTIHNDAGHLAATAELTARALGIRACVKYPDNDRAIEDHLGVDGITEGFMLTVALTPPLGEPLALGAGPGRVTSVGGGGQ